MEFPQMIEAGERVLAGLFLQQRHWAVFGASADPAKFGYKVFCGLRDKCYKVYPVNPKLEQLQGYRCYQAALELPVQVKTAVMILPPAIGRELLEDIADHGIERVWFQPGAYDLEMIDIATGVGLQVIYRSCILQVLSIM